MYKRGDKVKVSFDLADRCPFLKHAPVTCSGVVQEDQHTPYVKVYVDAEYNGTRYLGPVVVPQEGVTRRDAS